jgi:hypothetical protein
MRSAGAAGRIAPGFARRRAGPLQVERLQRSVEAVGDPVAPRHREAMAACSTTPAAHGMKPSTNRPPIMIEVPPARIPEEPGAVIPHAGICKGGVGQPASLP